MVGGTADRAAGSLTVLDDGFIPLGEDDPSRNFFFAQGSNGRLVLVDLGKSIEVASVASYSWHYSSRAAQRFADLISVSLTTIKSGGRHRSGVSPVLIAHGVSPDVPPN